ncbi:hypothetical protein [Cellulomonas denverensis]|uniref:hypothetical protein n=1 Tax=Cellulomonas denverensis TaxID=264297 RepID=UPI0035EAEA10
MWASLVQRNFTTGEGFNSPGGTIYVTGSANLYYPQGNDWSGAGLSTRVADKAAFDVMVSVMGLDRAVTPNGATWAGLHLDAVQTMQARSTTGQVYQAANEDYYNGREQWVSMCAGLGWLTKHIVSRGMFKVDEAGRTTPAGRLVIVRGSTTVATPTTSLQSSAVLPFGVTFLAAPTVLVTTPINSSGARVSANAVAITTTGFQVRYVASANFTGTAGVEWVALGLIP